MANPVTTEDEFDPKPGRRTVALSRAKHWGGYGWFMSLGTILPLIVFLASYLVNVTLVGAPVARRLYPMGIWLSTFGQPPPGQEKLDARASTPEKESFVDRVRRHSPPGILERRGRPVPTYVRVIWFVLVGWWLGAIWVLLSWSVFLLPYPFLSTVASLIDDLPSVMTLAYPEQAGSRPSSPGEQPGPAVPEDPVPGPPGASTP
jgi:hypothetical protein